MLQIPNLDGKRMHLRVAGPWLKTMGDRKRTQKAALCTHSFMSIARSTDSILDNFGPRRGSTALPYGFYPIAHRL